MPDKLSPVRHYIEYVLHARDDIDRVMSRSKPDALERVRLRADLYPRYTDDVTATPHGRAMSAAVNHPAASILVPKVEAVERAFERLASEMVESTAADTWALGEKLGFSQAVCDITPLLGETTAPKTELDMIPPLSTEDDRWVTSKAAATLESLKAGTLRAYRNRGVQTDDKNCGIDSEGRPWRRTGTPRSHPYYLKSSLLSQKSLQKS